MSWPKPPDLFAMRSLGVLSPIRMTVAGRKAKASVLVLGWCALGMCFAAATTSPAFAREYRLGVLQIENDDVYDDALAPLFMQHLRAVLAERSDVLPVETNVTLTQLSLGQACNVSESSCLLRITSSLHVDGILFGKLTHEGGEPVAILRRYDARSASIDASALVTLGSQATTDAAIHTEAEKLVTALLGEAPAAPQPAAAPKPSAPAPVLKVTEEPAPQNNGGVSARTVVGYSLLGGAAVSVGLTVLSFLQIDRAENNRNFENYRVAVGQANTTTKDVCDEASSGKRYGLNEANFRDVKRSCSSGMTFEVLQYVFLGSAVLTGGLATFLLLGGGEADQREAGPKHISLRPNITRSGVSVTARMHF